MKSTIRLRAFAKINLGLKILGQRPDGYHEIRTVYQTVALHDRLEVWLDKAPSGIIVECQHPSVPAGPANLVYRACTLWKRARKFRGGIRVFLEKRIPPGSGLGGGSSDAAVTLLGLEQLAGHRLNSRERLELAARLGSDVPFFLWGGRGLGIGRGEEVYPLPDLPRRHCLLIYPGFPVFTREAYRQARITANPRLTGRGKGRKMYFFGAWPPFPLKTWEPAENDFERTVFARWPELARLKRQLIRAGAKIASLAGSGSAVYALFDSAPQLMRAADSVPAAWQTFPTRTLSADQYQRRLFA